MGNIYDTETFGTKSLADGETETLTLNVDADDASLVTLLVDDGTADNQPPSYDVTYRTWQSQVEEFVFLNELTGITDRRVTIPAVPPEVEIDVTNASGANADFRAVAVASDGSISNPTQADTGGGIRRVMQAIEDDSDSPTDLDAEHLTDVPAPDVVGLITWSASALETIGLDEVRVSQRNVGPVEISDPVAQPTSVDLIDKVKDVDVFLDLNAVNADYVFEVSQDDQNWREHTRVAQANLSTGGEMFQFNTAFQFARSRYAGADGDVDVHEIAAKGL